MISVDDIEKSNSARISLFWAVVLVAILIALYYIGHITGLQDKLNPLEIRQMIQNWGIYGVAAYLFLFCIGLIIYVPGVIFMLASGLAYGKLYGILVAFVGANLAITFSFTAVRYISVKSAIQESNLHPRIQKMLSRLHGNPVRNVALMRCILSTAPGLNYGLALSSISQKNHIIGTLIGTIIPVTFFVIFADWLMLHFFS